MRLSKNPKMIDLTSNMKRLNQYLKDDERFMAVLLFGSYGTQFQHLLSDVDFGVLTREKLNIDEQLKIMSDFTDIFHEDDINIVFLNDNDLVIQNQVITTGRLVFCRDDIFLADFIEYVSKRFIDFQIDLNSFYRDYDQALKEEFMDGRSR